MDDILSWFQSFLSVIKTFEIKDVIDIVCVTFIIYALIKFIRDTKAVQLLKGAILLILVYLVATFFNFTMLSALLRMFVEFGVLIIIIIFQPEIRSFLEKLGRSKFSKSFGFSGVDEYNKVIEAKRKCVNDVVAIAKNFSKKKVGALIVFEQETKLGDIINTGTIVDAAPSVSLFGNMFFNKAPLHDGAVIVRNGRIYAAGCILPLTKKNSEVDVNLGTRHRAAIGMSEESDAVIVVVSEETGGISIANQGRLTKMEDSEELKNRLERLVVPETSKNDFVDYIPIFSSIRKEKKNTNEHREEKEH
ncbi:MAG: diadenylate cyclase CdaA [Acutalibacteraceae bacterium]|nr:diadenylate cyclase CdaA [Acutalibacteraceae bacterium]